MAIHHRGCPPCLPISPRLYASAEGLAQTLPNHDPMAVSGSQAELAYVHQRLVAQWFGNLGATAHPTMVTRRRRRPPNTRSKSDRQGRAARAPAGHSPAMMRHAVLLEQPPAEGARSPRLSKPRTSRKTQIERAQVGDCNDVHGLLDQEGLPESVRLSCSMVLDASGSRYGLGTTPGRRTGPCRRRRRGQAQPAGRLTWWRVFAGSVPVSRGNDIRLHGVVGRIGRRAHRHRSLEPDPGARIRAVAPRAQDDGAFLLLGAVPGGRAP